MSLIFRALGQDDDLPEQEDTQLADEADDVNSDPEEEEEEEEESEANFEGDTIQSAQDRIISELSRLKDSE